VRLFGFLDSPKLQLFFFFFFFSSMHSEIKEFPWRIFGCPGLNKLPTNLLTELVAQCVAQGAFPALKELADLLVYPVSKLLSDAFPKVCAYYVVISVGDKKKGDEIQAFLTETLTTPGEDFAKVCWVTQALATNTLRLTFNLRISFDPRGSMPPLRCCSQFGGTKTSPMGPNGGKSRRSTTRWAPHSRESKAPTWTQTLRDCHFHTSPLFYR